MYKPVVDRSINNGEQQIYRFDNSYGASVVRHEFSYGSKDGLYELAVIKFKNKNNDSWDITYDTPITDDVLGYLSEKDVKDTLDRIATLKA